MAVVDRVELELWLASVTQTALSLALRVSFMLT
jgi:hypothetical protein